MSGLLLVEVLVVVAWRKVASNAEQFDHAGPDSERTRWLSKELEGP